MKYAHLFLSAVLCSAVCGCNPTPAGPDAGPSDAGPADAFRDCQAVCERTAASPCECTFTCGGHLTTASCTASSCQCTVDGAPTMSFAYTICGPADFLPGCHPELFPDAGTVPVDAGRDAGDGSP
jgi:hypothetical protein